ncbi:hypothetical protein N7478_000798 [Penicillium angulare]|uniref:uncharacterized protein n=1 Tax=Penicillium angulare TaxID=116970 RepID=UPI0025414F61|nr:uncharacterized protein N7478_000798 [Penicillium angulare]KAJ5291547.1 hypothetical protein N7478_000798 [Penicillium angulare]
MDPLEQEQIFTPTDFSANWRQMFPSATHRRSIYSIPLSETTSQQADCPFEYEIERPQEDTFTETANEEQHYLKETGAASYAFAEGGANVKSFQKSVPSVTGDLLDTFTTLKREMEEQFQKQEIWNENVQREMEALATGYGRLREMESTVNNLEDQVKAISRRKNVVSAKHSAK